MLLDLPWLFEMLGKSRRNHIVRIPQSRPQFFRTTRRTKTPSQPALRMRRYSYLSASIGAIFIARLAGRNDATNATATKNIVTLMNVIGSCALTP